MIIGPSGTIYVKKVDGNQDYVEEILDPGDIGAAYASDLINVSGTADQNSEDIISLSGYTVLVSGNLQSDINQNSSDITSLSGYVDSNYVSISGDTMTGFLTLHADPTQSGHAATKQYVDSASDIAKAISFSVGDSDIEGIVTTESDWTPLTTFVFPGSDVIGTPSKINAVIHTETGKNTDIRIYDYTNANQIAILNNSTNTTKEIKDLGTISNVPTAKAIWEVQMKGNGQSHLYAVDVEFTD
jgi:hypothetical protein